MGQIGSHGSGKLFYSLKAHIADLHHTELRSLIWMLQIKNLLKELINFSVSVSRPTPISVEAIFA